MEENADHFTSRYLAETWVELVEFLLQHPDTLIRSQLSYREAYFKLYQELIGKEALPNENFDKRFRDEEWNKSLLFDFIRRSYLLLSQHVDNLFDEIDFNDEKTREKFRFTLNHFISSISPSNFINTNPEVISKIAETNGFSLMSGFRQLQADLQQGKDIFHLANTDLDSFTLGGNIACTPGKIILQNDLMQLIQYTPITETVYQFPLLIIPPWVNKYYILDLQPENSLVKWLVDQGFMVFIISWVNPSGKHRDKKFVDYMTDGPLAALKVINKIVKTKKINLLGYCIGGTLLGCMLAYLHKKAASQFIQSATFLTTLFDFSKPGELGVFIDEKQISLLEKHMKKKGYIDGKILTSIFNALRANDLVWFAFVNNYLKGQKPKPFDLLYWNADSTNIPEQAHKYYLRNMYLNNQLIQADALKFKRVALDLSQIATPSYFLAARDDHIIPWKSSFESQFKLNSTVKFVLTSSGHVAGVINPPIKQKYGYWTNDHGEQDAEKFLASATYHVGSWWSDWVEWLKNYSGKQVLVKQLDLSASSIEAAPGSYVKVRLTDIEVMET